MEQINKWQVNINIWQVNVKFWQVNVIIWQMLAEMCNHKTKTVTTGNKIILELQLIESMI